MTYLNIAGEASPQKLLNHYQKPNLESVFLQLCLKDDSGRQHSSNDAIDMEKLNLISTHKCVLTRSPPVTVFIQI